VNAMPSCEPTRKQSSDQSAEGRSRPLCARDAEGTACPQVNPTIRALFLITAQPAPRLACEEEWPTGATPKGHCTPRGTIAGCSARPLCIGRVWSAFEPQCAAHRSWTPPDCVAILFQGVACVERREAGSMRVEWRASHPAPPTPNPLDPLPQTPSTL